VKRKLSFNTYLTLIVRHPVRVLVGITLITLLLAWHLPRLSFRTTVYDLIIEDLPEARYYQEFKDLFGSDELIRLVVEADDILDPATFAKVTRISEDAARIDGVRRILSLPEIKKSVDPGNAWDTAQFAAMLTPVTLLERNLISADRKTAIITLVLGAEADKDAVIAAVKKLMAEGGKHLSLYQTGMPLVSQALADYTQQDFFGLTPITLAVIALLLIVLFRNLQCVVLPLACVTLSMIWTFGLMALAGVAVSMLTIIVPVFLIAVGTAYCLHICSDYLDQMHTQVSAAAAVQATYTRLTLPVTLAVVTTMIGIGSLAANNITAIREFAFFACFGILSLLIIALTFFPAVLTLLPAPVGRVRGRSMIDQAVDRLLARIVLVNLKYQKQALLIIGAVALIGLVGIFLIRVETNPVSYFKRNTTVSRNFHDIYTTMSGSFPVNVTLTGKLEDYFEDPGNLAAIARLQEFLDTLPGVDKTISFADYLKLVNYVYNKYDPKFYTLPQDPYEMRYLLNNFKILLGNDMLQRFLSPDYSQVNILMLTHIASSTAFMHTKAAITAHAAAEMDKSLHVEVTGLGVVIAASSDLLTRGQVKSLSISLVLIFLVMVALFVSSKVGLIAILPNIFPILVNFGLMGLFGIPLSVATSLIASVAIGLAVDDTIHYLVRYNSEFKKDLDKDRAMRDTVMHVGRPIIFTSCTISLGFAVLIFSHFQPTALFGILMVVTMLSALVGDLILLPALMMHVELVTAWDLLKMIPTVGSISPAMVHELNQPLNAIKVGSDFIRIMVRRGTPVGSDQLASVSAEISEQVARAAHMIQRLSDVAEMADLAKAPLQINGPINETIALLENQLRLDNITLTVDLAEPLPAIMAHRNRMVQLFYNVVLNSWEAIVEKKKSEQKEEEHSITIRSFEANAEVVVSISDTGIGIEEHYKDRILEPFFTTKTTGKGKGLGLSIVNQIVRDGGGQISVKSTPGQGTTVTVSFPALIQ
jgi:predicted RND superfamily exporter protein